MNKKNDIINDEDSVNKDLDSVNSETENTQKVDENSVIDDLNNEIKEIKNQLLLAIADGENLRKRFEKEREDLLKYSLSKFALEILQIVDNVERAISSIPDNETFKGVKDGMQMNKTEILNILSRNKINKISVEIGDEFNPHEHQAMMEESNDELKNETIGKILQNGYRLHERILRPTMVSVVKNK